MIQNMVDESFHINKVIFFFQFLNVVVILTVLDYFKDMCLLC